MTTAQPNHRTFRQRLLDAFLHRGPGYYVTYPHRDGDVTVLGPEVFASSDGSVISWKGENYTRQAQMDQAKEGRCIRVVAVDASLVPESRPEEDAERLAESLRREVRAALEASGRSQASIARELQVSTKHLNQMLQGHAKLTLWWAARILRSCGMRLVVGEGQS